MELGKNTQDGTNATVNEEKSVAVGRDTNLDISSLLKASKEEAPKEKSNLEKMKEAKAKGSLGLVVDNAVLEKKDAPLVNKTEDDATTEVDEYLKEQDKLIDAAKKLNVVDKPTSPLEMAALMDSVESFATSGNIEQPKDTNKTFIKEKTEDDVVEGTVKSETTVEESTSDTTEIDEEKKELVTVLIDKTGLGGEFNFTDEEKSKLVSSTEIQLKEIESIDIGTIKVKKPQKSFIESVEEFQISSVKVPVVFPASRFRAYMTGLSYGEMGDIALNGENITFDQIHKKLTVIYNKMINPSIGKFENFEDFLRKFSYVDIDLAVYGLVVATFPEVDDIPLECNEPKCKKSFNHKFSPRTLLRFEKSDNKFLQAMKEVVDCPASDFAKLAEQSPTQSHQRFRLPYSGFIIEVGIASSYDYLYNIVDNMLGEKFQENHPDDVNGILQLNSTLLALIRAVYVPDGDGYVQFTDFEDMINALYMIKPEEISFLSTLLIKYTESYSVTFELTDIVCPHCGTKTKSIPIDINYLVFQKYQRLMNTEINIDNISVL